MPPPPPHAADASAAVSHYAAAPDIYAFIIALSSAIISIVFAITPLFTISFAIFAAITLSIFFGFAAGWPLTPRFARVLLPMRCFHFAAYRHFHAAAARRHFISLSLSIFPPLPRCCFSLSPLIFATLSFAAISLAFRLSAIFIDFRLRRLISLSPPLDA
jgi:hypothetical protein